MYVFKIERTGVHSGYKFHALEVLEATEIHEISEKVLERNASFSTKSKTRTEQKFIRRLCFVFWKDTREQQFMKSK